MQCSRKRVQPLKKRLKKVTCVWSFKKGKNVKTRNHLVMQPFNYSIPEVGTSKSR